MYQFHPSNPFRSVAWRWERARVLREQNRRSLGGTANDVHVVKAFKFQIAMEKCKDDVDRWNLMESHPDLYAAYLIFQRGGETDRHPMRYVVEARLLAGQATNEIADLLGISPEVITLYEKLFFNISEKLQNTDYIMTCVLGPSVYAGLSDRDYDLLWKLYGYLYGPVLLDTFVQTTSRKFRPETAAEVDAVLADDARSALQRKVAVVTRAFVVNPFSQSELLNIYARFLEVEKETASGKAQDVIMQNIQVMFDKLPWQAGEIAKAPQIAQYEVSAAELRTDELMLAAVGQPLPNQKLIEGLTFPEPKDAKPK